MSATAASPELRSQQRQDTLGIQLQETGLIRAGAVEDEVAEAELDIRADLRKLLLRVGGNDPAARRPLGGRRVGEPLHLYRVLDAHLFFRGQGEGRPMPGQFL